MADNWGFVLAAYGLAAVVFGGYWRHLVRRARELTALAGTRASGRAGVSATAERRAGDAAATGGGAR
jgi:hypothetical protein